MDIKHPTLEQIPQLRQLWKEAFGDTDAFLDCFFSTAFSPDRCLCATVDCQVAAVAYWFRCGKYAYIYAVATAKKHRGKGICHALMEQIHHILAQEGYCGCILVPGDEGLRQFYGRMGYEDFGGIMEFECESGIPLPLRKIDVAEFVALRQKYLPDGGVMQDGENMAFLSHWASFYQGEDFLLAATQEDDILRGLELLGNQNAAPGIVAALGAKCGTFRTAGITPFAMWLPLCSKKAPTYFGFAFD